MCTYVVAAGGRFKSPNFALVRRVVSYFVQHYAIRLHVFIIRKVYLGGRGVDKILLFELLNPPGTPLHIVFTFDVVFAC